jgi:hypothetical protein
VDLSQRVQNLEIRRLVVIVSRGIQYWRVASTTLAETLEKE